MTWGIPTQEPTSGREALQRVREMRAKFRRLDRLARGTEEPVRPSREQLAAEYEAEQERQRKARWEAYLDECAKRAKAEREREREAIIERSWQEQYEDPLSAAPYAHIRLRIPLPREISGPAYMRRIIAWSARKHGFSVEDVLGNRRTKEVVAARHLAIQIIAHSKRLKCMSLPEIGRRMGGRDHTTILHAARKAPSYRNARKPNPWQCR